ncbi:hypothetical protein ACLOJK_039127 [Asimina triloba]
MAGLGGDGRMQGLGRRMGEEKRRGLGGRWEAGHWKGREGWEDTRERRREGDSGTAGGWSLERVGGLGRRTGSEKRRGLEGGRGWLLVGAGGLGRRTGEKNRRGLGGGGRLVAGGGGRAVKTAWESRREGDDGCRLLGDDGWERR